MFQGSLPSSALSILCDTVKNWKTEDIYIGCSGNFTIERTLVNTINARLHGNDVTVYSCILGDYFSGNKIYAKVKDSYDGPMRFVEKYMTDDAGIVSVVMLLSSMGLYLGSKPNPYYEKMIKAYINQWEDLFSATQAKISEIKPYLASFHKGDVCEWIDTIPNDAGVIMYPPFFGGDYEKMFKALDEIIEWEAPQYDLIDKDKIFAMFEKLTKREHFVFGTNDDIPEFAEFKMGLSQTTNRGVPLYMYSKTDKTRIVAAQNTVDNVMIKRIGENEDIGDKLTLIRLTSNELRALRSQYMNAHIKPGSETAAFGVMVDDKLIGVFALSAAPTLSNWEKHIETPTIYLLSDFPVAPTKYKRMAKLVLYAALSKETKLIAERITNKRVRTLVTTAFTKKPVSMKYRGLFKLLNKTKMENKKEITDISTDYYNNGFKLNYGAAMGNWTLQEGLEIWKQKHGKDIAKNED